MGEEHEQKGLSTGALVGIVVGSIAAATMLLIVGCAGAFFFWSYGELEVDQSINVAPPAQAQEYVDETTQEKKYPDESIPGIVDNIDRRLDQFDELGAPVDREKNEKLKAILGDFSGSEKD